MENNKGLTTKQKIVIAIILAILYAIIAPHVFPQDQKPNGGPLQEESKGKLQRFIFGEFAKATVPLPCDKKGFHIKAGEKLTEEQLRKAIRGARCLAAQPGDTVQVTRLDFEAKAIRIDLNGGSKDPRSWAGRHIQGGIILPRTGPRINTSGGTVSEYPQQPAEAPKTAPATIIIDFGRPVPDMTPDELKRILSVVLDFSKQRSASVQWVETLPKEHQEAISGKYVVVGMDKDAVVAAIGKPDQNPITERRGGDGPEEETWMYGNPPNLLFVILDMTSGKVICIKKSPDFSQCKNSSKSEQ